MTGRRAPGSNAGMIEEAVIKAVPKGLFIGGDWQPAAAGATFDVEDPATEETLCEVADARAEDAVTALDAAAAAQASWAASAPEERSEILSRAFEALRSQREELALLMTLEMGKPISEARAEVAYAAEFFRWFAGEALRLDGSYKVSANGRGRILVMKQPVGPALLITPWNFPMAMGTRKIGPAIATGCAMVVKPAKQTPLSMLMLASILSECGLPAGALNLITTSQAAEATAPLFDDPRLRKLSFTGSTEVGRELIARSAPNVLRVSMELGGNAPFLIFDDADLDAAIDGAMLAKMRNGGEACTAANRFYVARGLAEEFSSRLGKAFGALVVGRGTRDDVRVGPLIDEPQRRKVIELVEDATSRGATCTTGGRALGGSGYFFSPTVLSEVPAESRLLHEEIFGPVAPVVSFASEQEAIAAANRTEYGLVAYVFTRDLERALRVCEALETGMVGLNQGIVSNAGAPFGGVKQSGLGREGGQSGVEGFLETKYVAVSV